MFLSGGYQNFWQCIICEFSPELQKKPMHLCSDLLVSASSLTAWNHPKTSMLRRTCSEPAGRKHSEQGDATTKSHPSRGFHELQIRKKKSHEEHSMAYIEYCIVHRVFTGSGSTLVQFLSFCCWWFQAILPSSIGAPTKVNLQVHLLPSDTWMVEKASNPPQWVQGVFWKLFVSFKGRDRKSLEE